MPLGDPELKVIGNRLHARLLREDDTAVKQELADQFLPLLVARLRRSFPKLGDPHLCETAAIDALLDYFGNRERFNPQRADLLGYLYVIASRDLLNAMDKERRETAKRSRVAVPTTADGYQSVAEQDSPIVRQAMAQLTNRLDAEILSLMMDGVRNTAAYAEVLGIGDRPAVEQAMLVKQHKDRVKAKVRRGVRRSRVPVLVWLLTTRQRATAMIKRLIPSLMQVIAVAVLVGTQVNIRSMLKQTGQPKSLASGPSAQLRHLDGERVTINDVSGTFEEKILFCASDEKGRNHIWEMNPDGTDRRQITFGESDDGSLAISPDGLRLAFDRLAPATDPNSPRPQNVWVMDLATGRETRVALDDDWPSGLYQSGEPTWSPDGTKIAFTRTPMLGREDPERFRSIWTIDVVQNNSAPKRLTPASGYGYIMPQWSPDGRHILCMKYLAEDAGLAIYRIDLATLEEQEVIPWAGDEYVPRYSPDGSKILWITYRHTNTSDLRSDVYVADLADPIATQYRVSPYSGWGDADWSPDGVRLVMVRSLFRLTHESLSSLEEAGVPHWLVRRLSAVRHDYFLEAKDLLAEAHAVIGEPDTARMAGKILGRCEVVTDLCVAKDDGTGLTRLFESKFKNFSPRWAIVFQPLPIIDDRLKK